MKKRKQCRAELCASICLCNMNVCRTKLLKKSESYNKQRLERAELAEQVRKLKVVEKERKNKARDTGVAVMKVNEPEPNVETGKQKRNVARKHCCT